MTRLAAVFAGWDGYQTSLRHAVEPLTPEHLAWRPAPERRSVGEIVRHVALGRVSWFARMGAPGIDEVVAQVPLWASEEGGAGHVVMTDLAPPTS